MVYFNKFVMKKCGSNKQIKRAKEKYKHFYLLIIFLNLDLGAREKTLLFRENSWIFQ